MAPGRTLSVDIPEAFAPLLGPMRYKGAHGGRGSAKSHTFAELLLIRGLQRKPMRAMCVREVQKSLDQSVKKLLEDKIGKLRLQSEYRITRTYIGTPGGGRIDFIGMQDHTAESVKSFEGYDVAWVEEAQSLSETSLTLLRPTIRKEGSELWFTWNPKLPTDPVDMLLRGVNPPPNATVVKANYSDNPWFPEELRNEMLYDQARDPEKYRWVWLGEYQRNSEARVFKNWTVEEFDTSIIRPPAFNFGADWGFSVDPTVLIRNWIERRTLYIDQEKYQVACEIDDTPALFDELGCQAIQCAKKSCRAEGHGMARRYKITADSARPETISYMKRNGYPRIVGARKGAGSIEEGVTFLQNFNIKVHPRCKHTIDELTLYSYKIHPLTGEVLPVLEDKKNHVIDATRYSVEDVRHAGAGLIF